MIKIPSGIIFGLYAKYQSQTMLLVHKNNTSKRTAVILPDCTSETSVTLGYSRKMAEWVDFIITNRAKQILQKNMCIILKIANINLVPKDKFI